MFSLRAFSVAIMVGVLAVLAACGGGGKASAETVNVTLSEFKIESSKTTFERGKTYEFVVANRGAVNHEFMMGTRGAGHDMATMMAIEGEMGPGMMQRMQYTFEEAGQFEFACHLPGHYEAGMVLPISVS